MADIYDIKKRADELSAKWKTESIPPEEVGDLIRDLADYANQTEINGSSLGIRKTYATVSAMEADSNPVDDKDGTPLRRGMLVNIYNQDDASAPDNGKVFSWQNPGWQLRTKLDAGYATTEQVDAIKTEQDEKFSELDNKTRLPYDDKYSPSEQAIKNGAATMLINGYLDIPFEEGMSYSFAIYYSDLAKISLYKKPKDISPSKQDLTKLASFVLSEIENSAYFLALPEESKKEEFGNSWFIINKPENTYYNMYDKDGCGLSPKIFKGGINSNIVIYEEVKKVQSELQKKIDSNSSGIAANKEAISSNAKEIDANKGEIKSLNESFDEREFEFKNFTSPLSPGSTSSTFSGWGMIIGTELKISGVKIKVANRGEEPMKTVRFKLFKDTYNGELLVQKDVSVNISNGETQEVECTFDEPVYYDKNIYMLYLCDQLCSRYSPTKEEAEVFYEKYTPADDESFPKLTYVTRGNLDSAISLVSSFGYQYVYGITIKIVKKTLSKKVSDEIKNETKEEIREEVIPEIDNRINGGLEIILPDKIYATVDDTLQLFYRGMIKAVNPYIYDILVSCAKGKQCPRYFEYRPTSSDVGDTDFTVSVRDIGGTLLATKTCKLVTVSKGVNPAEMINIAPFGDSLSSAGIWCRELDRRLTESGGTPAGLGLTNIKFVGQKKNEGTGYFGVGGWTWESYTTAGRPAYRFQVSGVSTLNYGDEYTNNGNTFTVIEVNVTQGTGNILCSVSSLTPNPQPNGTLTRQKGTGDESVTYSSVSQDSQNPLWDYNEGKMTFKPYVDKYCDGKIDCVITLLTWNGVTPHQTDFSRILSQVKIFADTLHSEYPLCKMKICGIQAPSLNGGMGANYGAKGTGYSDMWGMFVTALNMNKAYQEFANRSEYKDFVEFVNISAQFDSEYNMPYVEKDVNLRNSKKKEIIGTNGVHPDNSGYYQISDAIFRNIVASFCQPK